jgi:UDP-glucose 4-epimerase
MPTLITGAAGFIGSNLTQYFLEKGRKVIGIDDLSSGDISRFPNDNPDFTFHKLDIRDAESTGRLFGELAPFDTLVHLAAEPSVAKSIALPLESHRCNLEAALKVFDVACRAGVKNIVFASTAAVYGPNAQVPSSETEPLDPVAPYAIDKSAGERYLRFYAEHYGISATVLRFFNVYGPNQDPASSYSGVISRFIKQFTNHGPITFFGDGQQTRDFVNVKDICSAIDFATTASSGFETYNVGTGNPISLLDLTDTLEVVFGHKAQRVFQEPRAGDIRHSCADVSKLKAAGWKPEVSLLDGLSKLCCGSTAQKV